MSSDDSFGPQLGSRFDFTLLFDHTILSILPSGLMVLMAPLFILHYKRKPEVILPSALLWFKMAAALALVGIQIANLVLWIAPADRHSEDSTAATILACAASLFLAVLLHFEHWRSIQSSAFLAVWLTAAALFDGASARSYYRRSHLQDVASLTVAGAAVKAVLVLLEEWPKTHYVKDKETGKPVARGASSGFWNRALFLWLNKTLYSGYKFVISFKDLDELDPMFDSNLLAKNFSGAWAKTNQKSRYALAKACLRASVRPCLAMIVPRLCFTFFMFVQPFFIDAAASCLKAGTSLAEKSGVIGAAALIYMGVGITRSLYTNMNSRFATVIRGMIMSAILAKPFSLPQKQLELGAAVTHMSTDMDGIVNGLPYLHELWINCCEFIIGLYLLATMVGAAAFLVAVPTFLTSAISWYVGERLPTARARWNERVEIRVAKTSTTLSQLKATKMVGLEHIASKEIEDLRNVEIEYSIKARVLACMVNMTIGICEVMTPTLVLAGAIFWTTFTGTLNAIDAFKTIAIIALVTKPLKGAISCYSEVLSMFACGERVQKFVSLDEMEDQRQVLPGPSAADVVKDDIGEKGEKTEPVAGVSEVGAVHPSGETEGNYAIRFADATIAPRDDPHMPVVFAITLLMKEAEFLILSGATGSGKSLFLRSVLGETKITAGKLFVKGGAKGYCGQNLWIKNGSIKDNVVGFSPFDASWYECVMHACLLQQDVARLPGGDEYSVGSNGANLSGGQKQRLAAARALYARTPFLLLDDIFSSLDLTTADMMFHRVFGKDGLIRRWNPTVILTTHSKEYFPFADRVVSITSDGLLTVRTDVRSPEFLSKLRDTTVQNNGHGERLDAAQESSGEEIQDKDLAPDTPAEEGRDPERQRGDFWLYVFFLKTIGAVRTLIWLFLTISTVVIEKFPDVFLRIWLDRAPDNKLYFLGYALFSMSGCFIGTGMLIYWFSHAVPVSLYTFHQMILETVVKAKLSVITGTDHGTLLSYFSQDITMASQTFPQIFMRFVYVFFFTLGSLIISLSATKFAAPVAPAIIVVVYFIQRYYLRTSRQIRHLDLEGKEPLYTHLTETVAGLEYIRGFQWEQQTLQRSLELLNTSQKPFYLMFAIQRWLALVIDLTACGIAVVLLAIALNLSFSATEASLALSLVALITFSDDVNDVVQDWTNLETSLGAISRLRRLVKTTPVEANPEGDLPKQWPWKGKISFTNVVAKYDETKPGRPALDGMGIDIPGGAKIGITGRTGSGKSSILMALLNFLDYTGTIHIDGVEISTLPPHFVRSRISTISQELIDLEGTVRHNLCPWLLDGSEGMRNPDENIMITLLWRLGLWDAVYQGGGLDVKMAKLGLSQGQKQLMGIARSLLRRIATGTSILLVDEATSNLDHDTEKIVHEVIQETFADCTVITVSHRSEMLKSCNVILHVEDGKITSGRQPTVELPAPSPPSEPSSLPQAPPQVRSQAQELRRQRREERERLAREEEQQRRHHTNSELSESVRRRFRSHRRQAHLERQREQRERQRMEDEEQRRLEEEQDRLWFEEQEARQSLHEETEREFRRSSEE